MNKIDIYVINLKERADRYAKIKTKFNFKSINLIFIEAIKNENGAIGCFLSHKKCIQYAKTSNMDKIIVIEDDCLPIGNDFEKRLLDIKLYLDNHLDWDIFLGGVNGTRQEHFEKGIKVNNNENLIKIKSGACAHFIIYNHTSYDFFLGQDENKNVVDKCWENKLKAFTCYPFLFFFGLKKDE